MSVIESTQVKLGLTKNPKILKICKQRKQFRKDKITGEEFLSVMFDGQEFRFRPGRTFTLGKSVADSLIRSSVVVDPNDEFGDLGAPFLEKLAEYSIDEAHNDTDEQVNPNVCELCGFDAVTQPRLARHLMKAHADDPRLLDNGDDESEDKAKDDGEEVAVAASARPRPLKTSDLDQIDDAGV